MFESYFPDSALFPVLFIYLLYLYLFLFVFLYIYNLRMCVCYNYFLTHKKMSQYLATNFLSECIRETIMHPMES